MSVGPSSATRTESTPSGGVAHAWARMIPSKQKLLRVLEVVGWILGHGPGSYRLKDDKKVFTYKTFHTVYVLVLVCLVTGVQIFSFVVQPRHSKGHLDTPTNVAAVTPHYTDIIFFYFIVAFNLYHASNIKTTFEDVYRQGRTTVSPSFFKQFVTLFIWLAYVGITIGRAVVLSVQFFSVEKTRFTFGDFIVPFINTYIKIYMTWILEVYILVCLNLCERMLQLKALMTEVITPKGEGLWNQLDLHVIEGVINQHRCFNVQASRFFKTMSPALFVLISSFFINQAFGLQTFFRDIVYIEDFLKPMELIELLFLLAHFLLIFAVCYVSSSISDQWCCVGREVTAVPLCRVTDRIRVQLLTFIQQLPHQAPVITGAGFFVISKSFLLTMMNFIATYIIFMVQFYHA